MKTSENSTHPLNEDEIELLDALLLEYGWFGWFYANSFTLTPKQ